MEQLEGESEEQKLHREFYEHNRVAMLQYESLRKSFSLMVEDVLGKDYYNMGLDVYNCDRLCCRDITTKANRTIGSRILELLN
jgi:hypothetical protein